MNTTRLYPELSDLQRIDRLKAQCSEMRQQVVERPMTQEEKDQCFETVAESFKNLEIVAEEIKEMTKAKKAYAKTLKTANKQISKPVIEETQTVFDIQDFENNRVITYDCEGNVLQSRRMTAKDKQLNAFVGSVEEKLKEGTNN